MIDANERYRDINWRWLERELPTIYAKKHNPRVDAFRQIIGELNKLSDDLTLEQMAVAFEQLMLKHLKIFGDFDNKTEDISGFCGDILGDNMLEQIYGTYRQKFRKKVQS